MPFGIIDREFVGFLENLQKLATEATGSTSTLLQLAEQNKICQLELMGFGTILQRHGQLKDGNAVLEMTATELLEHINLLQR